MLKAVLIFAFLSANGLFAAEEVVKPALKGGEDGWLPPKKKIFTKDEVRKACAKYRNDYISYYDKVFKVESCKRRELMADKMKSALRNKKKVEEVEAEIIAMIPEGEPIRAIAQDRGCSQLNRKYILSTGGDMYFVEGCKKRLFPDWDSYKEHSKKRGDKKVFELSDSEYSKLKEGKPFASVIDASYSKENIIELESDVIPLKEACAGVNGTFVSYYSKIYKIESCRKRLVAKPEVIVKKASTRLKELSSEQWLSLPDGKAYN